MSVELIDAVMREVSLANDPRRNKRPWALRQVSNRVCIPSNLHASNTQAGHRCWQINYVDVKSLRIYFANFYVTSGVETGCGGAMTVRCQVEYPRGTFTTLQSVTIPDGGYDYVDVPVTIPAYKRYRINWDIDMAGSGKVPRMSFANVCDRGMGDEYVSGAGGYGHTGDSTVLGITSSFNLMGMPLLVLAQSDRPVWGVIGSSSPNGNNDTTFDPSGGRGTFGRPLARFGPHLNYGVISDRASYYVSSHTKRVALMQLGGVTSIINDLGRNDITNSRTSAQLLADRATMAGYFSGIPIFETTINPVTTSTDAWKTAANQTATSGNTERVNFNTSMRQTPPSHVAGLIDLASICETDTTHEVFPVLNGGVWLPGFTDEGTHCTSQGYERFAPMVRGLLEVLR